MRGSVVRNRVTPLFALYSAGATDYATFATPQSAMAQIRFTDTSYKTVPVAGNFIGGAVISGYTIFPHDLATPNPDPPRAMAYVLTTEFSPNTSTLHPLYSLYRKRAFPIACTGGAGCNLLSRDFIALTAVADLEAAVAAGCRAISTPRKRWVRRRFT